MPSQAQTHRFNRLTSYSNYNINLNPNKLNITELDTAELNLCNNFNKKVCHIVNYLNLHAYETQFCLLDIS